jgi:O-antigen/teichoic acid export membrane protein
VVTRLYRPEDFGVLAVYAALSSIVAVVASLRFDTAIPLPEEDAEAANLLAVACVLAAGTSALLGLSIAIGSGALSRLESYRLIAPYAYLLPLSVLGSALFQAFNYWAVRKRSFVRVARTKLTQAVAMLGAQAALGAIGLRPAGLLAADVLGRGTGTGTLALAALRVDRAAAYLSLARMRQAARAYRRFPIFAAPAAMLNALGLNLASLLMAGTYGSHVAGEFALSQRILALPLALLGDAVSQVYVVEASRLARDEPQALRGLLLRTTRHLGLLAAAPAAIVALLGPFLFRLAFGTPWSEAGVYGQLLAGMLMVQLAVAPVSQTLNVLHRQDWQLAWDASRTALVFAVFTSCGRAGIAPRLAVGLYAVVMIASYILNWALIWTAIGRKARAA